MIDVTTLATPTLTRLIADAQAEQKRREEEAKKPYRFTTSLGDSYVYDKDDGALKYDSGHELEWSRLQEFADAMRHAVGQPFGGDFQDLAEVAMHIARAHGAVLRFAWCAARR